MGLQGRWWPELTAGARRGNPCSGVCPPWSSGKRQDMSLKSQACPQSAYCVRGMKRCSVIPAWGLLVMCVAEWDSRSAGHLWTWHAPLLQTLYSFGEPHGECFHLRPSRASPSHWLCLFHCTHKSLSLGFPPTRLTHPPPDAGSMRPGGALPAQRKWIKSWPVVLCLHQPGPRPLFRGYF